MAQALTSYQNLVREIKRGKIEPLYFFYGQEQVLAQYVAGVLQEALIPVGMEQLNLTRVDGQRSSEAALVQALEAPPMFGTKRLVIIEQPPFVKPKKGVVYEQWEALLDDWPTYTCAVLLASDVDKRLRSFKELVRKTAAYEFPPLTVAEAASWVEERLRRAKIQYPAGSGRFIVTRCGTDLELLRLEIEKIASYAADGSVSQADLELLVRDDTATNIFDFVDTVGLRNFMPAWALLTDLLTEGNEPVYLIAMIGRQLRLLLVARMALDAGLSQRQATERLRIHPFPAGKCVQQARLWTREQLQTALEACLQADEDIKSGALKGESSLNCLLLTLNSI